jgi:hypothetical protein
MTNHQAGALADRPVTQRLDTLIWGLLFVWIGIALLLGFSWGIGLLGFGVILLGGQAARKHITASLETFWVVVGAVLVIGGLSDMAGIHVSVIPIACIVAGFALLLASLSGTSIR